MMPRSKTRRLVLPLLLALATPSRAAAPASSTWDEFWAWPGKALARDEGASPFPLWNTRSYWNERSWEDVPDEKHALFSFALSGGALDRHRERQARRLASAEGAALDLDGEETPLAAADGAHDAHSDAHDMVVHVTYEDICKCGASAACSAVTSSAVDAVSATALIRCGRGHDLGPHGCGLGHNPIRRGRGLGFGHELVRHGRSLRHDVARRASSVALSAMTNSRTLHAQTPSSCS